MASSSSSAAKERMRQIFYVLLTIKQKKCIRPHFLTAVKMHRLAKTDVSNLAKKYDIKLTEINKESFSFYVQMKDIF